MAEPQEGMGYGQLLDLARRAEAAGFEAFFRSDHWLSLEGAFERPATDAWTTLAGLARETTSIRLGTLVSPVTFRHPVALAKIVATADEMSAGRIELGLGAGWHDPEHLRFGLPYPAMPERFDMLEEELAIIRGLWTTASFNFDGHHYRLRDAVCEPKPVQRPHPPIIVGGYGKPRTVRIAARLADELNLDSPEPADCARVFGRLDEECRTIDRVPTSIAHSAMIPWPAGPRETWRRRVSAYAAAGVDRLYLNVATGLRDLGDVERFGQQVIRG
jgi:F420-dependent oxidoreductase-like protein